jgi:hypothetical protein
MVDSHREIAPNGRFSPVFGPSMRRVVDSSQTRSHPPAQTHPHPDKNRPLGEFHPHIPVNIDHSTPNGVNFRPLDAEWSILRRPPPTVHAQGDYWSASVETRGVWGAFSLVEVGSFLDL